MSKSTAYLCLFLGSVAFVASPQSSANNEGFSPQEWGDRQDSFTVAGFAGGHYQQVSRFAGGRSSRTKALF
jgi:hypothetical protein